MVGGRLYSALTGVHVAVKSDIEDKFQKKNDAESILIMPNIYLALVNEFCLSDI